MSFDQTKWVWMNGAVAPWANATVHVSAHALHYGTGVFEGIRCYETVAGPAVFRLDAHLKRLFESAAVYGIDIPFTRDELADAVCSIIKKNEFASCYVRPICFYGGEQLALDPRNCPVEVAIFAWPWAAYLGDQGLKNGVRVTVSPWRKFDSQMMPATAKACGQYLNSILAVRDAVARGYDEALLLDTHGFVAEGSGENMFVVKDGTVVTNDERHSILMGVTRDCVIQIAGNLGYPVVTKAISLEDLLSADEVFLTGTAAEVTPVREVDQTRIGNGSCGPVTKRLQEAFFAAVNASDDRYRHWLHFVEAPALSRL